ncbi:hypothetical protein BGAL_0194g00040 [Botrytis galanthina]|uniref:SGF29 C-terminal domain-containing protein n=1 Tax=Botrytis galanthina TaxID=278940 RepID=A0A4S8R0F8_9HELO|nr:hypothetical protein BGAL_0194g00040 [Botrytis galanthina]
MRFQLPYLTFNSISICSFHYTIRRSTYSSFEVGAGQNTHNPNRKSRTLIDELKLTDGYHEKIMSASTAGRRQARGGVRSGTHERGEEIALWTEITQALAKIKAEEKVFEANIPEAIISKETAIAEQIKNGLPPTMAAIEELDIQIREGVKVSESTAVALRQTIEKLSILLALIKGNEAERGSNSRESHGRSSVTDDVGSTDSPVPSPAENKHVRKMGNGRTSSLPPKGKDTSRKSENEEPSTSTNAGSTAGTNNNNTSTTSGTSGTKKIEFSKGQEVAFKPRPGSPFTEMDWIQGKVAKVIGDGKSRRYRVEDVAPDEGNKSSILTSASSMCPIPPDDAILGPYEVGKRVLALYPETTTFYRAEVKAMLDDGNRVRLIFDGDEDSTKEVERRFVLDHSG